MSLILRYVFFSKSLSCVENILEIYCIMVKFIFSNVLQVSVYAVPDKKEQVHYALDTAAKLLEFYNTFFEIDYPLRKLGETPFLTKTLQTGIISFLQ